MFKKFLLFSSIVLGFAALTSCEHDEPNLPDDPSNPEVPSVPDTPSDDEYTTPKKEVIRIKDGGNREISAYSLDDFVDCAICVEKENRRPDYEATAKLRIMSDEEFAAYKEATFGDPDFPGLQKVDPSLCTLVNDSGEETNELSLYISKNNSSSRSTSSTQIDATLRLNATSYLMWVRNPQIQETLASIKYVIPVQLFSDSDSVDVRSNNIIFSVKDVDSRIICNVADGGLNIAEISRADLIKNAGKGLVYEPEVYFSVQGSNPWGFALRIVEPKASIVPEYADEMKSIPLHFLRNNDGNIRWELTDLANFTNRRDPDNQREFHCIKFPIGTNKVRLPLKIYIDALDPVEMYGKNLVVPITIENPRSGYSAIEWYDPMNKPADSIVESLVEVTRFYVGIKIVD